MPILDCVIFDIDGVLTDISHRIDKLPPEPRTKADWHEFQRLAPMDPMKKDTIEICNTLYAAGITVFLITGRDDCYESATRIQLNAGGVNYSYLLMRKLGNIDHDANYKLMMYAIYIKGKYNVLGVFEDRDTCVKMWRDVGLTCHQSAPSLY